MINMTVFDGEPRCHIDTCFWYPTKNVVFGILKASHFQYDAFLRERAGVKTKSHCPTQLLLRGGSFTAVIPKIDPNKTVFFLVPKVTVFFLEGSKQNGLFGIQTKRPLF
jgi:hypothetical protein